MIKIKKVTNTINGLLNDYNNQPSNKSRRSFKGLTLAERQHERCQRIRAAGLELYGTRGFFLVKIRDVCMEAGLTERYFYESFANAEELFRSIYIELINKLQQQVVAAIAHAGPDELEMARAGLSAFLHAIQDDGRMARILFVDAVHVKELSGQTVRDAIGRFDKMITTFFALNYGKASMSTMGSYLITGLNGYAIHIAVRWVASGFKASFDDVFDACFAIYVPLLASLKQVDNGLLERVTAKA